MPYAEKTKVCLQKKLDWAKYQAVLFQNDPPWD
jgi:hypothetical protein